MSHRLTFYWAPATVHAQKEMLVGDDTIPESRRINSQQWGILWGNRMVLGARNEIGLFCGIEWGVIHSVQQDPEFYSPITPGFAIGLDHYFALLEVFRAEVGIKSAYKYSTPDYRAYNRALGYGTHALSVCLAFRSMDRKR